MIQVNFRQNPAINWQTENPVLAQGEIGFDTTTKSFKIGDGRRWNDIAESYEKAGSNSTSGIQLLSTTTVLTNIGTKQNLFSVPAGKKCVVDKVVLRDVSASLETMDANLTFGFNSGANGVFSFDRSDLQPITSSSVLVGKSNFINTASPQDLGNAGNVLGCVFEDILINATLTIDVFGYLIDA